MKIKPRLVFWWSRLSGHSSQFSLATRAFHSICLFIILALAYNVPFNYFVGLPLVAWLSTGSLLAFAFIYYLSRFANRNSLALTLFCATGNLLFGINYFLNSGIDGPTDLFFLLTMVIIVSVVPVRQFWIFFAVNITVVLTLHYLQLINPEWVPYTYKSAQSRFTDISSAYVVVVLMMLINFYLVRRSYEIAKQSAEQKAGVMKVLNEEKNKLFSIIAHDLRAPLGNIQSYLEVLSEAELSDDERREMKSQLLEATRYTSEMLNNVLSWSQSQLNGLHFTLTDLSVYQLLLPQLLLFTNIAANKKIKVEVSIDHELRVMANAGMLQVIIRNLVNNAIKFTSPGGRIIFSAKPALGHCLIMVRDSGTGKTVKLPADIFYLKNQSTRGTNNEQGVGLGLVLCKEFTEALQGRIWFECDSVSGTTFFVEIPLVKA